MTEPRRDPFGRDEAHAVILSEIAEQRTSIAIARRVGCADLAELTRALYRQGAFKLAGRLNEHAA